MKFIFIRIALISALVSISAAESTPASDLAKPEKAEDRVLSMMRAVFLDALNARSFSGPNSHDAPAQLEEGYSIYFKHRLNELPQKESSDFRVFVINKVKVKFKGNDFVSEEVSFGYKLKYMENSGEILRWRETSGWQSIEDDPFFGKNPKLKNFEPDLKVTISCDSAHKELTAKEPLIVTAKIKNTTKGDLEIVLGHSSSFGRHLKFIPELEKGWFHTLLPGVYYGEVKMIPAGKTVLVPLALTFDSEESQILVGSGAGKKVNLEEENTSVYFKLPKEVDKFDVQFGIWMKESFKDWYDLKFTRPQWRGQAVSQKLSISIKR